jgi:hypothetical protein
MNLIISPDKLFENRLGMFTKSNLFPRRFATAFAVIVFPYMNLNSYSYLFENFNKETNKHIPIP